MREIGRTAGGQLGQQLGVEVAPAERLLLDLEAGELLLELRDARVLDRLEVCGSTSVCQTCSSFTCWPSAAGARPSNVVPAATAVVPARNRRREM
jgi:hypothetical protein